VKNRRAVVMGLGSFGGGLGAARYLTATGARVLVTDLRGEHELSESVRGLEGLDVETVLGEHRASDFETADLVVVNPAVRPGNAFVALARSSGARITSEIELFLEAVRARVVCVTGTQGKSSTCHVLSQILSSSGLRTHLGGNIGRSLLSDLDRIGPDDVCVLELSSYQLAALADDIGGRVAGVEAVAVTNVLADHLSVHGTRARYAAAKRRVLELLQDGGVAVLPAADSPAARWKPTRGRTLRFAAAGTTEGKADLTLGGGSFRHGTTILGRTADCPLPGAFQLENVLVALGLAEALGVRPADMAGAVADLTGLDHRLEFLGTRAGRRIHDNAVSTTPDSTVAALRSLPAGLVALLGGRSKSLPLDELARVAAEKATAVVCFGEARAELGAALRDSGVSVVIEEELERAVAAALALAPEGGDVLFSPACSSFDAFPNFRARALAFRAALPTEKDA